MRRIFAACLAVSALLAEASGPLGQPVQEGTVKAAFGLTDEDLWPLCVKQMDLVLESVDTERVLHTRLKWWYFIDHARELIRRVPEQGAVIFGLKGLGRLARALGREREVAWVPGMVERMSAADARRCLENVLKDPAADRPRTPYGYHYLVEALYVAGLRARADTLLLSYWGGMVERGADTFWEAFVPGDDFASPYNCHQINSACHAWSCAPSYFGSGEEKTERSIPLQRDCRPFLPARISSIGLTRDVNR